MKTQIDSPINILSEDLLKVRLFWAAHDLDKTINSMISSPRFHEVASHEVHLLEEVLGEWENRSYVKDDAICWAIEVKEEYYSILNDNKEINIEPVDYNKFDSDVFFDILKTRRSIRSWSGKEVSNEKLLKIIEAGQWAPSACNRQSVRYLVLTDKQKKQLLVNLREEWLSNAPVLIFVGADKRNYLDTEHSYVPYMDTSMASQNMLLCLHSMGLGAAIVKTTGWEISEGRSKKYSELINNMYKGLNLPEYFLPAYIIALGYPNRVPKAPTRLLTNKVAHFNEFPKASTIAHVLSNSSSETNRNNIRLKIKTKHFIFKVIRKLARYIGIDLYVRKY